MTKLVFDDFEIDLDLFRLQKDGVVIPIGAKPLDLLIFLIENRSRVASKTLIRENVWAGISLSEATIPTAIMAVRKALGDTSGSPQYILSERARGYRCALPGAWPQGRAHGKRLVWLCLHGPASMYTEYPP